MFRLSHEPILGRLLASQASSGSLVTFEGLVRDRNSGTQVVELHYEADESLALNVGTEIIRSAIEVFHLLDAACIHRLGKLNVGELAIKVEVSSAHRQIGFEACEWIVGQIKRQVPIWKHEFYTNGSNQWLLPDKSVKKEELYARQILLKEIGTVGQQKLKSAHVLVIGAGGLGCAALPYLASAGIGKITIIDPGLIEASNLHRQPLYGVKDIGRPKVEVAAKVLRSINPFIEIEPVQVELTGENCKVLIESCSAVIDGTDNFAAKFLINDCAIKMGIPHVHGGIYQFEGQVMVIEPGFPCLRCLWPTTPQDGEVGTCAEVGVLGTTPAVIGSLQASECLKLILGIPSDLRQGNLLIVDLIENMFSKVSIGCRIECPVCNPYLTAPIASTADIRCIQNNSLEVEPSTCGDLDKFLIIDIREEGEIEANPLPVQPSFCLPMSRFAVERLPQADQYLLVCAHGIRSLNLAEALREMGDDRFYSLKSGLTALRF